MTTGATVSTTTKRAILMALFFTALMATYMTSISLSQSSFAQTAAATTTNANQTSPAAEEAQSSPVKGIFTPCNVTESTVQGPEYKPGPPFRQGQDFAKGIPGQILIVTGKVLNDITCKPVQGAVLDIWQSNSTGEYDYKGYNLRGKIVTDEDGNYVLNTVYPVRINTGVDGLTRPSQIHVIVAVPGQPLITTQVYFEDQPKDNALKSSLIAIPMTAANGTKISHFDFVVEDYREFDISKGLAGNLTIGALGREELNK
jgi:protocatechuate 3,4-dioxygenase beta subunit